MKKLLFAITAMALLAASCVREIREPEQMSGTLLSLTAAMEQPATTRTMVAGNNGVYWEKGDEIKVFAGTASDRFVSDVESGIAETAVFTGSLGGAWTEGSPLWAVYPFSNEAVLEGETLTAELPAVQTARGMSFARGMNLSVARTTTPYLQFYNVGGGLCFNLSEDGIEKVVFEGRNGETLAGKIKIGWQDDRPAVQEVVEGSISVTLAVAEGQTLEAGVWYYIVALPGALEKGFKLSFYKGNLVAQKLFDKAVTVKRSIYGEVRNADAGASYVPVTDENIQFKDAKVKEIVVRYFDTGKDGELSYQEAAAVRSFFVDELITRADGQVSIFAGTDIETFDEIEYFTGLTKIEDGAFAGCTSLTSITIPEFITEIGANAFAGCTGLETITIESETPPTIGDGAFSDTNNCPIIVPAGTTETYTAAWGEYAPRIEGGQPDNEIWYTTTDGQILTAEYANTTFDCGANLVSHTYQDGKGVMAFDIPVTQVKDYAFYACSKLSSVSLPQSVTSLGFCAFACCTSITQVEISEAMTTISAAAFADCESVSSISVALGNPVYDSRDNCNAIIHTETNTLISGCKNTVIPASVTRIEESAFEGQTSLSEIMIPESVTSIGKAAFAMCSNLENIVVPKDVQTLEQSTFQMCTGLKTVSLPSGLTSVGNYCFHYCSALSEITIPDSVTSIGRDAFSYCSALTDLTLPSSLTSIGQQAFYNCQGLWALTIPKKVTEIGERAFSMDKELRHVIINGAATIGKAAFASCSKLISVTLSESVVSIGTQAFSSCGALASITIFATVPPPGGNKMFNSTNDCPIYVPENCLDAYKAADYWKDYSDRFREIGVDDALEVLQRQVEEMAMFLDSLQHVLMENVPEEEGADFYYRLNDVTDWYMVIRQRMSFTITTVEEVRELESNIQAVRSALDMLADDVIRYIEEHPKGSVMPVGPKVSGGGGRPALPGD